MDASFLLRNAALGLLFKGYLHNLRGPVQALLMQIELLENNLKLANLPEEVRNLFENYLARMKKQVYRLVDLLAAAESELGNESEGPWDLKKMVEREVTFWEAELTFKHKVEKDFHFEKGPFRIKMPANRLRAGLCALFFALVFDLVEKGEKLSLSGEHIPEGVLLKVKVFPEVISPENPYLKVAAETLSPEAELKVRSGEISVLFKTDVS